MRINDAGALLIKNIEMFEMATELLESEVTASILNGVAEAVKNEVDIQADWFGLFSCLDGGEIWFGPKTWKPISGEDWVAWYSMDWLGKEDAFLVSGICGQGKSKVGFKFNINTDMLGSEVTKKTWKNFSTEILVEVADLREAGFTYYEEDGTWFLQFQIDPEELSEFYKRNCIAKAMVPVESALRRLFDVHYVFVKIVEKAKKRFRVSRTVNNASGLSA